MYNGMEVQLLATSPPPSYTLYKVIAIGKFHGIWVCWLRTLSVVFYYWANSVSIPQQHMHDSMRKWFISLLSNMLYRPYIGSCTVKSLMTTSRIGHAREWFVHCSVTWHTAKPVLSDCSRDWTNVVSYDRWSFKKGKWVWNALSLVSLIWWSFNADGL